MLVVAIIGLVLQIVGLVLAIRGVARTYRSVIGAPILPALWVDARRWWMRYVRRKPEPVNVTGHPAVTNVRAGVAHVSVGPNVQRPEPDASAAEVVSYVDALVEYLRDQDQATYERSKRDLRDGLSDVRREVAKVDKRVSAADRSITEIRSAVVGREGAGLRQAVVGLGITLVGTVLGLAGLPW